jgi:hypothetical protein
VGREILGGGAQSKNKTMVAVEAVARLLAHPSFTMRQTAAVGLKRSKAATLMTATRMTVTAMMTELRVRARKKRW